MNHQAKPKLKNSKTQIYEFMSFGLLHPLNRKKPFLISHDFGISSSWSQCASDGWRWRLSMNRKVGPGVLTPPPDLLDATESLGAVRTPRPTRLGRFMVPMRVRLLEVEAFHEPEGRAGCPHPAAARA